MIRTLLLYLALTSFSGYSQSENWEIYASQGFMPSAKFNFQYYSPTKKGWVINFHSTYNRRLKKRKRKERNSLVPSAFRFLKTHLNDSIYQIPLSSFDCNSADLSYLKESGLIEDSNLILNFNLFERQAKKTVAHSDNGLPVIYFEGNQIDGPRLKVIIKEDTSEIMKLNVGAFERSDLNEFQVWIIISEAFHRFNLFPDMKIEGYFSRERLSSEISRYVTILRR